MSQELEVLTEIRDLLRVMAEPALAERDASLRAALRGIVGTSKKNAKAAFLMDGSRSRTVIAREVNIDSGNLSRFVKKLAWQLSMCLSSTQSIVARLCVDERHMDSCQAIFYRQPPLLSRKYPLYFCN